MTIWLPNLAGREGPKYKQIVDALEDDIAAGVLEPGTRLPPLRDLAFRLDLSANTTSRAYAEAMRQGLLRGEVGRGTYVCVPGEQNASIVANDMTRPSGGSIDLSRNLPSPGLAANHLATTLRELGGTAGLRALLDYQGDADLRAQADVAIAWLARTGVSAAPDEVVVTLGAQHGVFAALMALTRPGDLLLTEELTYAPVHAMAASLGLRRVAAPLDEGGLCPDRLDRLCAERGPRALYLTPTLQTPTTRTLDPARRIAIAEIARRHDLVVIEDDVFGVLRPDPPAPIAALAPERTAYVSSVSKTLGPGLRVGFVRAAEPHAAAIRDAVNLSCWMPPPLMTEIVARWSADRTADRLIEQQRVIAARRQTMARTVLADQDIQADPNGLHLWLNMPQGWSAKAFRLEAGLRDVLVTEAAAFALGRLAAPEAVRLSLGHEADEDRLRTGLERLADILRGPGGRQSLVL